MYSVFYPRNLWQWFFFQLNWNKNSFGLLYLVLQSIWMTHIHLNWAFKTYFLLTFKTYKPMTATQSLHVNCVLVHASDRIICRLIQWKQNTNRRHNEHLWTKKIHRSTHSTHTHIHNNVNSGRYTESKLIRGKECGKTVWCFIFLKYAKILIYKIIF